MSADIVYRVNQIAGAELLVIPDGSSSCCRIRPKLRQKRCMGRIGRAEKLLWIKLAHYPLHSVIDTPPPHLVHYAPLPPRKFTLQQHIFLILASNWFSGGIMGSGSVTVKTRRLIGRKKKIARVKRQIATAKAAAQKAKKG